MYGLSECPKCGIVFEKYRNVESSEPATTNTASSIDNKEQNINEVPSGISVKTKDDYNISDTERDSEINVDPSSSVNKRENDRLWKEYGLVFGFISTVVGALIIIMGFMSPITAPDSNIINIGLMHSREISIYFGMFLIFCGLIICGIRELMIAINKS